MVGKRRLTEVRQEETVERDVTMNPLGQGQRILGKEVNFTESRILTVFDI